MLWLVVLSASVWLPDGLPAAEDSGDYCGVRWLVKESLKFHPESETTSHMYPQGQWTLVRKENVSCKLTKKSTGDIHFLVGINDPENCIVNMESQNSRADPLGNIWGHSGTPHPPTHPTLPLPSGFLIQQSYLLHRQMSLKTLTWLFCKIVLKDAEMQGCLELEWARGLGIGVGLGVFGE